jgi:SAM-dependent methyltransferase
VATDGSESQIAHAHAHPRVEYRVARAEESGLAGASVDLVTVAQALHWFDRDRFYAEVRRVLAPGGAIAVWSYGDPTIGDDPGLDAALEHFNHETVGSYWPPGRADVGEGYLRYEFPFDEVAAPRLMIERRWTLAGLASYLRSWSSTVRYRSDRGVDPVVDFEGVLRWHWGHPETRHVVRWPLTIRAGH